MSDATPEERLAGMQRGRSVLAHQINGINFAIQAAARQRTQLERQTDEIDKSAARLKRELGIPTSEWLRNELRMDHYDWYEQFTWQPRFGYDVRCPALSPETHLQCAMIFGHDLRWGHEHFDTDAEGNLTTMRTCWTGELSQHETQEAAHHG